MICWISRHSAACLKLWFQQAAGHQVAWYACAVTLIYPGRASTMHEGLSIAYMKILAKSRHYLRKFWPAHHGVGVEEWGMKCFPWSPGSMLLARSPSSNIWVSETLWWGAETSRSSQPREQPGWLQACGGQPNTTSGVQVWLISESKS